MPSANRRFVGSWASWRRLCHSGISGASTRWNSTLNNSELKGPPAVCQVGGRMFYWCCQRAPRLWSCLLYTSDAADDTPC
eukprot:4076572-Pyramimonas_sp.AAC.1